MMKHHFITFQMSEETCQDNRERSRDWESLVIREQVFDGNLTVSDGGLPLLCFFLSGSDIRSKKVVALPARAMNAPS